MCSSIVEKILKLKGIEKWSASDCKLEQFASEYRKYLGNYFGFTMVVD